MENCVDQMINGNRSIVGIMVESNLEWGNQPLGHPDKLKFGVSITDACIDWNTTETMIRKAHTRLAPIIEQRR